MLELIRRMTACRRDAGGLRAALTIRALTVGAFTVVAMCAALYLGGSPSMAQTDVPVGQQLRTADTIKTSNNAEFVAMLRSLEPRVEEMDASDRDYYRYLAAWQRVYRGDYDGATTLLRDSMQSAVNPTIRVRALATLVNVLLLSRDYEPALAELDKLLAAVPEVEDVAAREQAWVVASLLYNKVGQHDLAVSYAEDVIAANWAGKGACRGGQLKLEALFRSESLELSPAAFRSAIDACDQAGEPVHSSVVRAHFAQWLMKRNQYREALDLLHEKYAEVMSMATPRVASDFDAMLAVAYRESGNKTEALKFAQHAVDTAVKNEYTEPLVNAYRVLYLLAKERGDAQTALNYHEKYSEADRGYLNDVTARQLAYQRVKHEVAALNKQNEVLELQRKLSSEVVENSRLYILLLLTLIGSVVVLAFKMRRSQLHFKSLAQRDGLTGMFNRQHFIERTEALLTEARRGGRTACFVLCDLDHFKEINDVWGHPAGDAALRQAAAVFQSSVRGSDLVGRLGGEEFGVLLSDCDTASALERCEELRRAIGAIHIGEREKHTTASASFGIASTSQSGYEFRQLMLDADAALYDAKRRGRNCVAVHGALTHERAMATTSLVASQMSI